MYTNLTIAYIKLRCVPPALATHFSVQHIREALNLLAQEIVSIERKLAKISLPSFVSLDKKRALIEGQNNHINSNISNLEQLIKDVACSHQPTCTLVQSYFFRKLKQQVVIYRKIYQDCFKNSSMFSGEGVVSYQATKADFMQETINNSELIRESVFGITNTLIELKMILKEHTKMIDKIDYHLDNACCNLDETAKEIDKMPSLYAEYKNFVIYCLLYTIGVLFILILIKLSRHGK
ncbi:hypothetical protein ENBRE01_0028 [Enteropsectra breve]|nr:hypothetical protein ENBRE01_0028 [Enteropsectra breve]